MNALRSVAVAIFALAATAAGASGYAQNPSATAANQGQPEAPASVSHSDEAVVVRAKYVMKGETSNHIEFGPDGTFSLLFRGKVLVGTYKVEGDRVTYAAPWIPTGLGGARVAGDTIWDDDASVWEREVILTNKEVMKLIELDLGDEIVIAKIKNAPKVTLDVSTDALLALKKSKVSSPVIAAMIERAARSAVDASIRPGASGSPSAEAASNAASKKPADPCADIELMGLFKEDMRPMSPLIIYQAKLRNASSMTKIVRLEWLDMYAQAMQSTTQVGAGQIVTVQLAAQEPFQRQPINLRLSSCR